MSSPYASKIRARQIREADLPQLADLLARGFPGRPRHYWLKILLCLANRPNFDGLPKYGYLLETESVVGVILQIFSSRTSNGQNSIRCNVSSWYVEPSFRSYASLLVAKALSLPNVTYLNITPAPNTLPTIKAQGYSQYSKGIFITAPALQLRPTGEGVRVTKATVYRAAHVEPSDHGLLLDHATYGCISLWCETSDGTYPFVFRPGFVRGIIPSALLVYCRDVEDLVRFAGPIGRFLALRGRPLVLIDSNGPIDGLIGKYLDGRMPKYFKGATRPRLGDLAYTEIAMFGI
jgi:hypothetical protein